VAKPRCDGAKLLVLSLAPIAHDSDAANIQTG
jgi:hypothetical protein